MRAKACSPRKAVVRSGHRCHGHNRSGDEGTSYVEFEGIVAQWLSRSQSGFSSLYR
jgi:hypothetical protein